MYSSFISVLLSEYQQWLPESAQSSISTIWPPLEKIKKIKKNK